MAHIQNKQVHDSEAQHQKAFEAINAQTPAPRSSHGSPQRERRHDANTRVQKLIEEPSRGFEIMGFPWQFAAVVGIIAVGVLAIVLKAIGLI